MEFYIYKHIKDLILRCQVNPENNLDVDTIKEVLEDTHGIEIVDYAYEKLNQPSEYYLSFEYFNNCENIVDRVRRNLAKKVLGKDKEYIYILTNDSMPGIVKIGLTHSRPYRKIS